MLWTLWLPFAVASVGAFQTPNFNTHFQRSFSTLLPAANIEDAGSETKKGKTTLRFRAGKTFVSDPTPLPGNPDSERALEQLMSKEENLIDILRGAGNEVICTSQDVATSNIDAWKRECVSFGVKPPSLDNGDKVFCVTTGMNFPGLRVSSVSYIGGKCLPSSTSDPPSTYPGFEFVLIKDEQQVEGPAPLKWVFNKLTGNSGGSEGGQSVRSLNQVTVEPLSDGKGMVFQSKVTLEIGVQFPSIFLKLLPVSKEKAEEQGSASISKALDKDILPALKRVRDSWVDV